MFSTKPLNIYSFEIITETRQQEHENHEKISPEKFTAHFIILLSFIKRSIVGLVSIKTSIQEK